MIYKYFISERTDPYYNLALEQLLFRYCNDNTAVLYLWQNDNTIVVGKNQDIPSECRAAEFTAAGGRIARRRSGGGAVYHDLGNQNFSVICQNGCLSEVEYIGIIIGALEKLGITAEFNGKNDVIAGDKKVSGSAFYDDGHIFCGHGTVLICTDINKMMKYLTPNSEKLKRNGVKSVGARVINLSELNPNVTADMVRTAMIESVSAVPLEIDISEEDILRLTEIYADPIQIYGGEI